ncbi:MAG: hypothetical protein ACT4NY_03030 [Pseudonocardiales bacterium]
MAATTPEEDPEVQSAMSKVLARRQPELRRPDRSGRVTPDAAARLPRQTLTQTRADLVRAAIIIVNEYVTGEPREGDPPVDLLPFVRLDEVLEVASGLARDRLQKSGGMNPEERVAPLTPGAFYKAFASDNQDTGRGGALTAFHRLVTREMVDEDLVTDSAAYSELGDILAERKESWREIVRIGTKLAFQRWANTPAVVVYRALTMHALADKEVGSWTRSVYEEELAEILRVYEKLLKVYKRRMRPGISMENLAVAISDLISGMALNGRVMSETRDITLEVDIDGEGSREWHLCALAAWGIYNMFTEPDE